MVLYREQFINEYLGMVGRRYLVDEVHCWHAAVLQKHIATSKVNCPVSIHPKSLYAVHYRGIADGLQIHIVSS